MRLLHKFWILLCVSSLVLPAHSHAAEETVRLPIENLSALPVVAETAQQLEALGCVGVIIDPAASTVTVPNTHTSPVIPTGTTTGQLFFCTSAGLTELHVTGRVAGKFTNALALTGPAGLAIGFGIDNLPTIVETAKQAATAAETSDDPIEWAFTFVITIAIQWASAAGLWLLHTIAPLVHILLSAKKFISHPIVAAGWPFVQGVANLGFIFALLFMAFATVLRIGGGWQRLLPRLIFAALLINFSLVIGGLIIDVSRVMMAIISRTIAGTNLEKLPIELLKSSGLFSAIYKTMYSLNTQKIENSVWTHALATLLIWGLLASFVVLIIGLFMRYVTLLFLLVVSPLAFLGIALPGTSGLVNKWWSMFLKNVFYGPAALFLLTLVVAIQPTDGQTPTQIAKGLFGYEGKFITDDPGNILGSLLPLFVTMILLVLAATIGKTLGVAGSGLALSMVRKAPGWARRNPGKAGAIVGAMGLGPAGFLFGALAAKTGQAAVTAARNQARDFGSTVKDNVVGRLRKSPLKGVVPAKRDDKGKLKPGEGSFAQKLATKVSPYKSPDIAKAKQAIAAGTIAPGGVPHPALTPAKLLGSGVLSSLTENEIRQVVVNGIPQQINLVVQNKDAVKNMDAATKADILAGTYGAQASDRIERTLRDIARDESK